MTPQVPRPVPLLVESFLVYRDGEPVTVEFRDSPKCDASEADIRLGEFRRDEAERRAVA